MIVNLRIGGRFFSSTKETLTRYNSRLKDLLPDDSEGWINFDRDERYFNKILNFFRDGSIPLPETRANLTELLSEAEFYQVEELIREIRIKISSIEERESGLNTLPKAFLIMSSEIDALEEFPELSSPEIRLTIGSYSDSHLFRESTMRAFAADFDSFSSNCENSNHKLIYTKHYVKKLVNGDPTSKWSFISDGNVITRERGQDFNSVLDNFVNSYHQRSRGASENREVIQPDQQSSIGRDPNERFKLNIGGVPFYTTRRCLSRYRSMLNEMQAERLEVSIDLDGYRRFDRSGEHFDKILSFLETGVITLPESREELCEILAEAEFYRIRELIDVINRKLMRIARSVSNCKIFMINSADDDDLWRRSARPTVKLTIQNISRALKEESNARDSHALWKHLLHFDRFCCFSDGTVQFVQRITSEANCLWTFSMDGEVIEHNHLVEGRYRFKDYEMHEEMIKFLAKVLRRPVFN